MYASTILYGLIVLQGAMASPLGDPALEVEPRDIERRAPTPGDLPFPLFPALKPKGVTGNSNCPSTSQSNACSSGTPYCCVDDGKGSQVCSFSNSCNTKTICCNNNNGYQMCIGEIDFNMPVTININISKGNGKSKLKE